MDIAQFGLTRVDIRHGKARGAAHRQRLRDASRPAKSPPPKSDLEKYWRMTPVLSPGRLSGDFQIGETPKAARSSAPSRIFLHIGDSGVERCRFELSSDLE